MKLAMSAVGQRGLLRIAIVPALAVGILFELFLGHRHDYTGHFAAGYGATFAAAMLGMRILPKDRFLFWAERMIVPLCLVCIAAGAVTESTIFRLAKFDEIDFCNQSLGALLAMVCAVAYVCRDKPPAWQLDLGLVVGIVFVGIGGYFAVA